MSIYVGAGTGSERVAFPSTFLPAEINLAPGDPGGGDGTPTRVPRSRIEERTTRAGDPLDGAQTGSSPPGHCGPRQPNLFTFCHEAVSWEAAGTLGHACFTPALRPVASRPGAVVSVAPYLCPPLCFNFHSEVLGEAASCVY
ncbi:hypothetical protein DPEC_G00272230 [Dallia pectoralis]|uniref:Uncharacterized protein n=1 Tax=Dallia pectoralis TaxID=75939 RepID=A0ACC2FPX7_DALPE|nr:hypothetical protein DPEC_G00272230 [Dallia pectoralis]